MELQFNIQDDFKINAVIMNPPYNNGMDIDFVFEAYSITNRSLVAITPAKWQTAEGNQRINSKYSYSDFRKEIVPYMNTIVFYPCCKDVFNILQVDGITYYLIDKNTKYEENTVINKCKYIKEFDNSTVKRNICNRQSLLNIGDEILNYVNKINNKKFKFMNTNVLRKYVVWTNTQTPGGNLSTVTSTRKTLFIGESTIEENINMNIRVEDHPNSEIISFTSDSEQECKSFISWLNCKFTRFFTAINASKLTGIINDDCFRFVPAPEVNPDGTYNWNIIYTDELLYNMYGLYSEDARTTEGIRYIDIIESVVKERN